MAVMVATSPSNVQVKGKSTAKRYGVAYLGSKNKIAADLVEHLPSAPVFYDVFAGGCAVTHAAMLSGRFARFVANDFDGQGVQLFCDAVSGKFHDEKRWISREDFFELKEVEPYIKICWSFSNKGGEYLYSKEVEPWKRALHYARVLGDFSLLEAIGIHLPNADRVTIKAHAGEIKEKYIRWYLDKYLKAKWGGEIKVLYNRTKEEVESQKEELRQWLCAALKGAGLTQAEVERRLGTQMAGHYFGRSQWEFPTREYYDKMRQFMPLLDKEYDDVIGLQRLWKSLQRLESLQSLKSLKSLQSLERLQRLERLESLQSLKSLERLESLQSLKSLERLERLQSLESLQSLQIHKEDYKRLQIDDPEGLIYCDPPYKGTTGYEDAISKSGFNHDEFYTWCEEQKNLVVISEYSMPTDRFTCVWKRAHISSVSGTSNYKVQEQLFVVKGREDEYRRRMRQSKAQPTLFDYSNEEEETK